MQLGRAANFRVGEGDCMCEIALGQFNIFGAIEEKLGYGFPGIFAGQGKSARVVVNALIVRVYECPPRCQMNLVKWAAGLSTGLAQEMQKQFSVGGSYAESRFWIFEFVDHWASRFGTDCWSERGRAALRQFV